MKILIKLSEVLERSNDWEKFCKEKGFHLWCVNHGGGDIKITLSEEEAIEYGIIK